MKEVREEIREKVGRISVDSGVVMIVDPCYVLARTGDDANWLLDLALTQTRIDAGFLQKKIAFEFEVVGGGLAVASRNAVGDGLFPVYAVYATDATGRKAGGPVRLEIIFDEEG